MIFRSPLFSSPFFFLFLLAWHSVLDLHERSPDRKKKGIRLSGARNNFLFYETPPAVVVFLFLIVVLSSREPWRVGLDYRRGTVSYDTTDLRRARGVRFSCSRYFTAPHRSQTGSRSHGEWDGRSHPHQHLDRNTANSGARQNLSPIFRLSTW